MLLCISVWITGDPVLLACTHVYMTGTICIMVTGKAWASLPTRGVNTRQLVTGNQHRCINASGKPRFPDSSYFSGQPLSLAHKSFMESFTESSKSQWLS